MSSLASPRDPVRDHLLTPQNGALLIIDYQPIQVTFVASRAGAVDGTKGHFPLRN